VAPILINPLLIFLIDSRNPSIPDFYLLGEIYDFNNDTYEVIFENMPHFLIYTEAQNMLTYDEATMSSEDIKNYTLSIEL